MQSYPERMAWPSRADGPYSYNRTDSRYSNRSQLQQHKRHMRTKAFRTLGLTSNLRSFVYVQPCATVKHVPERVSGLHNIAWGTTWERSEHPWMTRKRDGEYARGLSMRSQLMHNTQAVGAPAYHRHCSTKPRLTASVFPMRAISCCNYSRCCWPVHGVCPTSKGTHHSQNVVRGLPACACA